MTNMLEALKMAYKFSDFYIRHLPITDDDWQLMISRANDIIGDEKSDGFLCKVMVLCLDELGRLANEEK